MATIAASTVRDAKVIGVISFGHLLSHFYFLILPPILHILKDDLNVSYAALGLLMSGYGLAGAVAHTPMGFFVDRFGGRPSLAIGMGVQASLIALMGLAGDYWQLLALYSLAGVANTVYHPADYAILSASVSESRMGRAFGIHLFSGNFGWALTPAIMVGLTALWGWRNALVIIGLVGIAFAIYVWSQSRLLDDDIRARKERKAAAKNSKGGSSADDFRGGMRLLFTLPIVMGFLFFTSMTLGFTGLRSFFVAAMDEMYGTPLTTLTAALTGFLLGSAIGIIAGGILADRIGAKAGTAFITLFTAAALIVLIGSVSLPVSIIIAALSVSGFLQGVLLPTRDLLIRTVTPEGSMGKVMGFLSSGTMLAAAVVQILFGWILDVADPNWVFWASAIFIMGALFSFASARSSSQPG